jgi:type IV secretion system protein VirD4
MNRPQWLQWIIWIAAFVAATLAFLWLAGFLFFLICKASPAGKIDLSTWITYWNSYQDNALVVKRLKIAAFISALISYGLPLYLLFSGLKEARSLHGDARFANTMEVVKAGLFAKSGIIVGKLGKRFLMFRGMQFVLLAAPTRSGKGIGIVIPNLLNWPESVVSLDVKLENFLITSKFRAKWGQDVYLFNPFSISEDGKGNPIHGKSHRYNPLGYVSDDPRLRVTDILAIGYSLYPGEGKDSFFDDAARNLFLGLTLYLCETPAIPRTMGELLRQSSGKGRPVKDHLLNIIKERNTREFGDIVLNDVGQDRAEVIKAIMAAACVGTEEADRICDQAPILAVKDVPKAEIEAVEALLKSAGAEVETTLKQVTISQGNPKDEPSILIWDGKGMPPLSMECVDAINRFTSTSDNTLSSIMATFNVPLTLWASPIVDAATSANDFDLRDVRKKRMSIYLGIPANKLAESKILLNMFYTQLVNLNTNRLLYSTPELKYTCLMLNDEFAAPGRIAAIDNANSFQAGYGMRLLTIVQSPGQLEAPAPKGYGRENARTFVTNHACQIFFTPKHPQDANEYSEALGYYTFKAKGESRQLDGNGSRSESQSDQKRALMLPQELREMSQREQIISLENTKPIRCTKINYFSEKVFVDRLKSVSPSLANLGKKVPTKEQLEAAWGSGECAVSIPTLNFDIHEARVQDRSRELTVEEIKKGIDLNSLALDLSKVPIPDGDGLEPEQVEAFVNGFFDALDAVNQYEGEAGESESLTFDMQVIGEDGQDAEENSVEPGSVDHEPDEQDIEISDPSDDEFHAMMMDDYIPDDDGMIDDAELVAEWDEPKDLPEELEETAAAPIIDLNVLNKPFPREKKASSYRM